MYLYKATLNRVVSPVTLSVNVDLGFGISKTVPVRLNGVSMPGSTEARAKAVELISDWVAKHPVFVVHTLKVKAPFDRYLGIVFNRWGGTLNRKLIKAGVSQEIPDCEVPPEETPETEPDESHEDESFGEPEEEVVAEEVPEEELPAVGEKEEQPEDELDTEHLPGEEAPESGDLLEDVPEEELEVEIQEEVPRRRRWRLRAA